VVDIGDWLRSLGLERYAQAFSENDVDTEILPSLTADDLIGLGVGSIGHRRKLFDAIAALRAGAPSGTALGPAPAPPLEPESSGAERRQLTVMFCDMVGSTELSSRLDPEDYREVIAAYHRTVAASVAGLDGFVAKYMGDGVLIYFGYPSAHEDDTERAVRAGLDVIHAVRRLDVKSVELACRVGIATGLVVVGDLIGEGADQEQSVVGETPNLAARLQALAEPGAVVIAAATRRLVGDRFEYRDLGSVEVKGIAGPVPAWQVLRQSAVESRFEALRGSALTPLIGRDEEIDLLLRRWARAKAGDGQVVLISGEPGIDKSRLTAELDERLRADPHLCLRYFCSPYHQDSALHPFTDQFGRTAGFARDDPPEARLEKLEALLARSAPPEADIALLADLMSLPVSQRHPLPNLSPRRKKELTLAALMRRLEGLARRQPIAVVFEDAHWIDPTSRELLDLTVERVANLPVLLIITFRPEFQPPWTGQPQVAMLALNRLDRRDRTALVMQIAGDKPLPNGVIDQITERTDGVPLFAEELTKSVLESGAPLVGIPTTLHDSLMARLDRLASVRQVAQTGAAIGREFSYPLLRTVSRLDEDELQTALARLVSSELVFQRGAPPDAVYSFKHALVQEATYSSLLRSRRQQLHAQIADALEAQSPELMENQPELFGQHYAEAGLVEKSVACWGKAGRRSITRSAMAEAAAQLQKGLDQLALLPDTPERQLQELELCSALGHAVLSVKGQAAPETGQAYARARELWEQLGRPSEFFHVAYGQDRYYAVRGELDLALCLEEDLLRLSRQRNDSNGLLLGHRSSGRTLLLAGKFSAARLHLEAGTALLEAEAALYDQISDRSLVQHYATLRGSDPILGFVLFCLGFPDQAVAESNAVIAEAQRRAHPPALVGALAFGARLHSLTGDDAALNSQADQLVAVATEQGFAYWCAMGTVLSGWAKVKNGDVMAGLSLLHSGTGAFRATGAGAWTPYFLGLLAMAHAIAGEIEEALARLDDALEIVEKTGERWFAAELNRYKGELLLRQGHPDAVEELYRKALGIAREQEAKLWELRAAVSLARFWRDQGKSTKARDLLAPVYAWFTEGFDTPDLVTAKTLLDEL
jgi:class 3 adenylate cyclase/predicted ATPase